MRSSVALTSSDKEYAANSSYDHDESSRPLVSRSRVGKRPSRSIDVKKEKKTQSNSALSFQRSKQTSNFKRPSPYVFEPDLTSQKLIGSG